MDGKYFYEMANSQLNMTDRKLYLSTLTTEQRQLYTRYGAKLRQSKFNAKPDKREEYNKKRSDYKVVKRAEEPEKYKELNIKDVRAFREREKSKLETIQSKLNAVSTLTNAIRARKARKAMEMAAIEKANKTGNELTDIGNIIKGLIKTGKTIIENKQVPKKVGRPKKPRNPVGRPKKVI